MRPDFVRKTENMGEDASHVIESETSCGMQASGQDTTFVVGS